MNATLCEGNAAGMFVTLFYGVLNLRTGELQFANGGHNPPYIISSEGKIRKLAERGGPVLGVLDGWKYQTLISQMQPGDAIMLYTDGVTEAISSSNEFYGDDRLERYLESSYPSSPESIVADLHKSVKDFAKGAPQSDDITVLVLQYTPDAS
jgi:sigma-B regulation protein RsbU (phosphoserine phosphatase)